VVARRPFAEEDLMAQSVMDIPDVRCRMCRDVGAAYCDECAAAVFAYRDLATKCDRYREALQEIADAKPPPTAARSVAMQSKAREALGRNVWTNA
jgi:hypothetical protein